jgi:YggT family protein
MVGGNMFVFGNFVTGIAYILDMLLNIYFWIILIRVVLSWIQPNPYNPLVRTIHKLVDPVIYRISRIIPTRIGMIDFAPFILMIVIVFLQRFLIRSLFDLGVRMN